MNRSRSLFAALILALVGATLAVGPARAVDYVLDQEQASNHSDCVPLSATTGYAQTFTAGRSGPIGRVQLYLDTYLATAPVDVAIQNLTAGGEPTGSSLVVGQIPSGGATGFKTVTFDNPPYLVKDTKYAIVAVSSGNAPAWCFNGTAPYAGGSGYQNFQGSGWVAQPDDFSFRTYSVPATDVLDQEQGGSNNGCYAINLTNNQIHTQTFTAEKSGPLVRVGLYVVYPAGDNPPSLSIHATDGSGNPTGPVLAYGSLPGSEEAFTGYRYAGLNVHPELVAGTTYAIEASGYGSTSWCYRTSNPYAGGRAYVNGNLQTDTDFLFRTFIGLPTQTITFGNLPNVTIGEPDQNLVASASSGLPVTFTSQTPTTCTVVAGKLHAVAPGTCTIAADQVGDGETYAPATQVTKSTTVPKRTQTITFANPGTHTFGAPLQLTASASSGLPLVYSVHAGASNSGCSVNSTGKVTFAGVGACRIIASQAGNDVYHAATSVDQTFTVVAPTVTVLASSVNQIYGTATAPTVTPTITGPDGFDPAVLGTITCTADYAPTDQVATYPGATSCTGGSPAGYAVSYLTGNLTVTPAPLTITAGPITAVWGVNPPAPTPSYSGFRNDDTSEILATQPTCTAGVTASTNPGTYPNTTTCSGAVAGNYTISYVKGIAKVAKANIKITPTPTSRWKAFFAKKITFTVKVTHVNTGAPLAGVPVKFQARTVFGHKITCSGTTNASGVATCSSKNKLYLLVWGRKGFTATVTGTSKYNGAAVTGRIL